MTARPVACDLLISNATLLTGPGEDIRAPGALAVKDGIILAAGPEARLLADYRAARRHDAEGGLVHAGFIDAHLHVTQHTARSVLPLMAGKPVTMGHWKAELRPEDEYASTALAGIELLKCGHTGFVDPGTAFEPDAVAAAAEAVGIRSWLTDPYVADRPGFLAERIPAFFSPGFLARWPKDPADALARIGGQLHRNREPATLARGYIGIYGEGTDSLDLHAAALEMARKKDVPFQKHLGYAPSVYRDLERELGQPLLEALAARGLIDRRVTFIHMNRLGDRDIALLADHGVRLVWCPGGQLAMIGEGGARGRMASAHRAGVPIGIASDIARGFNFDGLGSLAYLTGKAAGDPITAEEVFAMRSLGAAASIGAEAELGSLEAGKRADVVIRRPQSAEGFGMDVYLEQIVTAGRESIDCVFVAGRCVLKDGRPTEVDEAEIVAWAHESARAIAARIGLA
ncbi:MAG: amidohydrolase family protein [Alphaproteobacteria bacterium]